MPALLHEPVLNGEADIDVEEVMLAALTISTVPVVASALKVMPLIVVEPLTPTVELTGLQNCVTLYRPGSLVAESNAHGLKLEPPPAAEAPPVADVPPIADAPPNVLLPPEALAPPVAATPPVAAAPPVGFAPPVAAAPAVARAPPVLVSVTGVVSLELLQADAIANIPRPSAVFQLLTFLMFATFPKMARKRAPRNRCHILVLYAPPATLR